MVKLNNLRKINDSGVFYGSECPICNLSTCSIRKKKSNIKDNISWEAESTMKLLGLASVESQIRFCSKCFHLFRFPLFDESFIYGEKGYECRRETYKKYFPEQVYGGKENRYQRSWFIRNEKVFLYLADIIAHAAKTFSKSAPKDNLKVLDWGGGDGYLVEAVSLISNKVLNVSCKAYCYDYHEWTVDSNSPYFEYITLDSLKRVGAYFDIIFLSHVLEHTAFPKDLLVKCFECLSNHGVIILTVPYEVYHILSPKSSLMHYHQHIFSVTSITRALIDCGFKSINTKLCNLSYRGSNMWNIVISASIDGATSKIKIGSYLNDIFNVPNIIFRLVFRKFMKILSAQQN